MCCGHFIASIAARLGWIAPLLLLLLLFNHVLPAATLDCARDSANVENRLKKQLLCNGYRADARPRKDHTQTVNLTLSYYVLSYEFEERDDLLNLNVMMKLQWYDDFLRWNSSEWNALESVMLKSDDLWLPDFRHFSSYFNPEALPDCTNPGCSVRANGLVTCLPVCGLNAKCDADYSRWPYDAPSCTMWYGLWANSMDEVDVHVQDVCLPGAGVFASAKWDLVSVGKSRTTYKSTDSYVFPIVQVRMTLQRLASFETVAVVTPIILLGLFNIYIAWLRSDSLERKLLLLVTTFCHLSFLQQLVWALPYNRDTLPGCLIFLACSLIMTALMVLHTLLNCWIRTGLSRDSTTGSFLSRLTGPIAESRVAELILSADYLELNYKVTKGAAEGAEHGASWEKRATLFDRVLAILCVVFYVTLFFVFVPLSHYSVAGGKGNCVVGMPD